MFADYFSTYYLHLQYGTIFVTANYFIAVMLPVLFAGPLRRPRAWAKLAGLILLSCAGMELCGAVLHALRGDANLQPFVGGHTAYGHGGAADPFPQPGGPDGHGLRLCGAVFSYPGHHHDGGQYPGGGGL